MARALFSSEGAPCLKCHMTGDAKHDARATAPNFTVAKERLKPGWTKRWMLHPAMMSPGTAMPSNLFMQQDGKWVFAGVQDQDKVFVIFVPDRRIERAIELPKGSGPDPAIPLEGK